MADYVLGMYDIRGKQEFIYRSTRIKEIIGGSAIIRDCFKTYLMPAAEKLSEKGKGIFDNEDIPFTPDGFVKHLKEGYIGEVVYKGGGNFLLLMKDRETFCEVTKRFTKRVLEATGTLKVLGTCIGEVDFDHYQKDRDRLYENHRQYENMETVVSPWGTLPIVQVDAGTSMPLVAVRKVDGEDVKVTREVYAKLEKYDQECRENNERLGEKILDKMTEERGRESLLGVIYIDGNNMGARVMECLKGENGEPLHTYEDCVAALRKFSKEIQKMFIDDRIKDMDKKRRLVVGAGDEITFICNARDAYDCAMTYLKGLPKPYSSCAGIAIFHSHAPYAEAYRIAEECCESGKIFMKEHKLNDTCFLDFHYCQGAFGTSLEEIREEEVGEVISKPWAVVYDEKDELGGQATIEIVERMKQFLNQIGVSNVKSLGEAAKKSKLNLELELRRIKAHMPEKKRKETDFAFVEGMEENQRQSLIYDMVTVYDLWFAKEEKGADV